MIYLENPEKKRYYLLIVELDLFDNWCLVRIFGSLINRRGRSQFDVCETKEQAIELMRSLEKNKLSRGYYHTDVPHQNNFCLRPQTAKEIIEFYKNRTKLSLSKSLYDQQDFRLDNANYNPDQQELF